MTYDPFLPEADANEHVSNKLLTLRKPSILDKRLTHLEWHSSESRKRPRLDHSHSNNNLNHTLSHSHSQTQNHTQHQDQNNGDNINNHDSKSSTVATATTSSGTDRHATTNHHQKSNNNSNNNNNNPNNNASGAEQKPREIIRIVEKPVMFEPTTIMGVPPLVDDRIRQLVHFILQSVSDGNIEIEAKLGTLFEKDQAVRVIQLVPVLCETPIKEEANSDVRFVSNVGEELFHKINKRLNARVEETATQNEGSVSYIRTRELDIYYPGRIRQTRQRGTMNSTNNNNDGFGEYTKIIRTQRKTRLGDLNVLCPGGICDIRYSASREEDCTIAPGSHAEMQREKDRISYKYEYVSVDITTVEMMTRSGAVERSYEVEVEIDPASVNLYDEVTKYNQGDESSKLFDVATSVVHTVRLLLEV